MATSAAAIATQEDWPSIDLESLRIYTPEAIETAKVFNFAVARARKQAAENKSQSESIAEFTKIIRENSRDALAWFARGRCYHQVKQYDHAVSDYTQAIRLDLNFAKAYNNRGVVFGAQGDHKAAIADYDRGDRQNLCVTE